MIKIITFSIVLFGLIATTNTYAHPGRTDSSGGHTCRTNCVGWGLKDGEYHSHSADGSYTNSSGITYDSSGEIVSDNAPVKTSEPQLAPLSTKVQIPISEPVKQPVVNTAIPEPLVVQDEFVEEKIVEEEEVMIKEETSTPNPVSEKKEEVAVVSVNEEDKDDSSGTGVVLATLAIIGGGVYYLKKRGSKKSN